MATARERDQARMETVAAAHAPRQVEANFSQLSSAPLAGTKIPVFPDGMSREEYRRVHGARVKGKGQSRQVSGDPYAGRVEPGSMPVAHRGS